MIAAFLPVSIQIINQKDKDKSLHTHIREAGGRETHRSRAHQSRALSNQLTY